MPDNHKRIARVYRKLGLQIANRPKKKRKGPAQRHLFVAPTKPNELWAMDFVSDASASGRRFRIFTIKDLFTHECLELFVERSIRGEDVARTLDRLVDRRGAPRGVICDNGTEFTSQAMSKWEHRTHIRLQFIRPGKPIENAFIESFNGKLRRECLDQNWFADLHEAKSIIEQWRIEYNTDRPTKPLGNMTPEQFAKRYRDQIEIQINN